MRPDTIALMLAALPATAFVVLYLLEYRHVRPTPESKHLIGFTAILAAIILEELVRRFWLTDMPRQVHRAFVGVTVTVAALFLWQRLYMLLRYQIIPRRRRARQKESTHA